MNDKHIVAARRRESFGLALVGLGAALFGVALLSAAGCAGLAGMPAGTGTGGSSTTGSGGAPGSGGASTSSGGAPGSGGASTSSGGASGSGGAGTGGTSTGSGGRANSGGTSGGSGGAPGSGGAATSSGGASGTGGSGTVTKVDLKGKKALLIVDNPASLDDGDVVLRDKMMIEKDMIVTVADTSAVNAMASSMNVIIASSGASGSEFATLYKAVAVPMIIFGNSAYQAMGMIAASAGKGTAGTPIMLSIVNGSTPLAGGLAMGTNFAAIGTARSTSVYWGTPGGAPINVASVMGQATQMAFFAYEKGAAMAMGTAPARRVGLGFKTDAINDLSIESFKLFNAALEWTAGAPP